MGYLFPVLLLAPAPEAAGSLIKALGDPSYERREAASRRLARLGDAAEADLRLAVAHPDAEVRARARRLLVAAEALPRGPLLRNAPEAALGDATAWYEVAVRRLQAARFSAAIARRPAGPPPSEEDCWREATDLMARAMLDAGCERWRVRRALEALGGARPPAGGAWPRARATSVDHPAETLARLEAALGLPPR